MSVIGSNILAGSSGQGGAGGYEIQRSLRFNSGDSSYLNRTPSSAGNRKTWTWSGWVKRTAMGADKFIFSAGSDPANFHYLRFKTDDTLEATEKISDSVQLSLITSAVYRDPSAWYHIIYVYDSTQATAADRLSLYVNGVKVTAFGTSTYPSQNHDSYINSTSNHFINARPNPAGYADAYLAEIQLLDGTAVSDASDFGEYDTNNVWQPKEFAGTYGTNGFHLDFSDNSSNAALGTDSSGNSNTWTVNNLFASTGSVPTAPAANTYNDNTMGFYLNGNPPLFLCKDPTGQNIALNVNHGANSGVTWAVDDVLQWAVDQDNGKLWIGRNNTWYSGNPSTATNASMHNWASGNLYLGLMYDSTTLKLEVATTAAYTPPTGYTYWSASSTGSWVGSGTSISNVATDIFNTPLPSTGKVYLEAKIKGGVDTNSCLGLINVGETTFETDALRDTPVNGNSANDTGAGGEITGNYCTLNPLAKGSGTTLSNGNLEAVAVSAWTWAKATIEVTSGKWYWEITKVNAGANNLFTGIAKTTFSNFAYDLNHSNSASYDLYGYASYSGNKEGQGSSTSYGAIFQTAGDIIGVALDMDAGTITFYKNGASQGQAYSGITGQVSPVWGGTTSVSQAHMNFGQRSWAYAAPTNYKALCTANLPDPTIADGSTAFDTKLWTGTGSARSISGYNFSPDLAWIKSRSGSDYHALIDTVRGKTKVIFSNTNDAEETRTEGVSSFNSDGFSLGDYAPLNKNNESIVGWAWDAGSSNTTIAAGGLNSSVYYMSEVWSDDLYTANGPSDAATVTTQSFLSGYPATNPFNGNGNGAHETYAADSNKTIVFRPDTALTGVTKLEYYTNGAYASDVGYNSATSVITGNTTTGWQTLYEGTAITVNYVWAYKNNGQGSFTGVKINGRLLVDSGVTPPTNVPTIASTVRANPSAGFSIVSYTGNATIGSTVGHGLSAKPSLIIAKLLTSTTNWPVYHISVGPGKSFWLDGSDAASPSTGIWGNIEPDANVFNLGGDAQANYNGPIIAYCFAPVEGYSAMGSYTGSSSLPFVYCGFRPAFIILKKYDGVDKWCMYDTARGSFNTLQTQLHPNLSDAESGNYFNLDILSNGFRPMDTSGQVNENGKNYVYIAFASHPFKTARAR